MSEKKEIFYHLGLGKVASTYLQHRFFPKLKGIEYIDTSKYRSYVSILNQRTKGRFLLSRENDRQLEREVKKFAKHYSDVKSILIFRRHDSWLASQYRRFVKNGLSIPFEQFIDLKNNQGYWDKSELNFFRKIEIIEENFDHKPLVLFHDEIKENPGLFFDKIAQYTASNYNYDEIDLSPFHKSYNEQQLLFMRSLGKYLLPFGRVYHKNRIIASFQRFWRMLIKYPILYFALLIPKSWFKQELLNKEYLLQLKEHFQEDWDRLHEYAKKNNPKF